MKSYSRAIIAGVAFLALLGWALTKERGRVVDKDEVFGVDITFATSLEVETEDGRLVLQRDGEQWTITEPINGWAENEAAERLVKAVAELKPTGQRDNVDLKDEQFGLTEPVLTATLHYGKGQASTIRLGSQTPGASEYFAEVDGKKSLLFVPAHLFSTLTTDPQELREKRLAVFESEKVKSMTLQYPDTAISLQRRGEAAAQEWMLTHPYEARADEWSSRQVSGKLAEIKAEDFAPATPQEGEDYGFDTPQIKATLTLEDGKKLVISFGNKTMREVEEGTSTIEKPFVFAQLEGRPETLLIAEADLAELRKTDMDLRDKRIVRFDRLDVQRIRVERKEGLSFAVKRAPEGWGVDQPRPGRAKMQVVDDLLWDLSELEAREFLGKQDDLREYGLAIPTTVITLHLKKESTPLQLRIGYAKGEDAHYAMTSQGDEVYVVSDTLLLGLPKDIDGLMDTGENVSGMPDDFNIGHVHDENCDHDH